MSHYPPPPPGLLRAAAATRGTETCIDIMSATDSFATSFVRQTEKNTQAELRVRPSLEMPLPLSRPLACQRRHWRDAKGQKQRLGVAGRLPRSHAVKMIIPGGYAAHPAAHPLNPMGGHPAHISTSGGFPPQKGERVRTPGSTHLLPPHPPSLFDVRIFASNLLDSCVAGTLARSGATPPPPV